MVSDPRTTKNIFKDPLDHVTNPVLKASLIDLKKNYDFDMISTSPLTTPLTIEFYKKWLGHQYHGDMNYLADHLPQKENFKNINPHLTSAITVAYHYFPAPYENQRLPARTAMYARNDDYHFWLKDKLKAAINDLTLKFPDHLFLPFVDSGPVLERDLAYKSGLGWFGKNTCLIHSLHGSLFFLAEILTSLPLQEKIPVHEDLCGKCTKCIDICPTGALEPNKNLNATQCISYLTIESKKVPPVELRSKMGDWFFGCDLCQTVCPWNQKHLSILPTSDLDRSLNLLTPLTTEQDKELEIFFKNLLQSSNKKIQKMFYGTALLRSGGFGLKRNALIVIANRRMTSLKEDVLKMTSDPKLSELAQWTLQQLG